MRGSAEGGKGVTGGLLSTGDNAGLVARRVQPTVAVWASQTRSVAQNQCSAESMYAHLYWHVCEHAWNQVTLVFLL